MIVLASPGVYGDPPVRPVLPAGTEIRIPGAQPFVLDEEHKLVDGEMRDRILAEARLNAQLTADLVACNQGVLEMSDPPRTPQWLVAAKWIGAGIALSGSFALGLWAGGAL